MASKQQQARRYWWYKEHGWCVKCHKASARPGRTMCEACAAKARERESLRLSKLTPEENERKRKAIKETTEFYTARGFCRACWHEKAAPGKAMCEACSAKRRGWYAQRKEAGICTRCGKAPAQPGRTMCEPCADRRYQAKKRHGGERGAH